MYLPYLKLISLIKKNLSITAGKQSPLLSNQLIILDSNNCSGLFFEDYLESLNLNVPHSLLRQCLQINETLKSEQKTRNFFLNSILVRENYFWKKSFTSQAVKLSQREADHRIKQQQDQVSANSRQQTNLNTSLNTPSSTKKLTKKQQQQILKDQQQLNLNASLNNLNSTSNANELAFDAEVIAEPNKYEIVPNSLLDLFDIKYSCSFLGMHEQHDLFYSSCGGSETRKSEALGGMKSLSLNTFDENKSGLNVLKRLVTKTKMNRSKMKLNEQVESGTLDQRSVL